MPDRAAPRTVDFNRIVVWVNAIVAIAIIASYAQVGPSDYVDGDTVLLATLLAFQTHVALFIERRRRDPFVVLLAFIITAYYFARILSLVLMPYSVVLDRFPYEVSDSNNALLFILIANTLLYVGFLAGRSPAKLRIELGTWRPIAPRRILFLLTAAILFIYTRGTLWNVESIPRPLQFVLAFLGQSFITLAALTYFVVFRRTLQWKFASALFGLLILEMVLRSLAGSRSAIVSITQNTLIVLLAVGGTIKIPRWSVVLGAILAPFMALVLVAVFTISTYIRAFGDGPALGTAIDIAQTAGDRLNRDYALESGLPLIFSRAGFFDYSAEIMAHREQYQSIMNVPAYLRSITDNVLTPGFDVFDQARMSNALRFAYAELGRPSKVGSAAEYQSDQFDIYGEMYVLFGYASLPLFLAGALMFKRIYRSFDDRNPFMLAIKRVITLSVFAITINSFGIDWIILDLVTFVACMYAYRFFFATAPDSAAVPQPA